MYFLYFYVAETHLDAVKNALFEAGAGRVGNYDCCAWQSEGLGQFRPLENSKPVVGEINKIERVKEYKVEMVCEENLIEQVIKTLLKTHPYESPAYGYWPISG